MSETFISGVYSMFRWKISGYTEERRVDCQQRRRTSSINSLCFIVFEVSTDPSRKKIEKGLSRALEKKSFRVGFVTRSRKKILFELGLSRALEKNLFESGLYQPISKKYFWNLLLIITFDVRGVWRCSCVQNDRTDRAVILLVTTPPNSS